MLPLVSYKIFESTKDHPHRIKKSGEMMVQELNYQGVEFPVATKHYGKIEHREPRITTAYWKPNYQDLYGNLS